MVRLLPNAGMLWHSAFTGMLASFSRLIEPLWCPSSIAEHRAAIELLFLYRLDTEIAKDMVCHQQNNVMYLLAWVQHAPLKVAQPEHAVQLLEELLMAHPAGCRMFVQNV